MREVRAGYADLGAPGYWTFPGAHGEHARAFRRPLALGRARLVKCALRRRQYREVRRVYGVEGASSSVASIRLLPVVQEERPKATTNAVALASSLVRLRMGRWTQGLRPRVRSTTVLGVSGAVYSAAALILTNFSAYSRGKPTWMIVAVLWLLSLSGSLSGRIVTPGEGSCAGRTLK